MGDRNILRENIYFIGGGTCCGKSTLARMLCDKMGAGYYRVDDDLEKFILRMAADGNDLAPLVMQQTPEEMWMRDPVMMADEEEKFYEDMFPYALEAMSFYSNHVGVVAEGAGFMPSLMHTLGVASDRYICLTPTKEFQVREYAKRPWIHQILEGTSNPDTAFSNWMERDEIFAKHMREQAQKHGYSTLMVDGTRSIEENFEVILDHFGFAIKK